MRKGVSIVFALMMMLSGAHVTIATHFCGGHIAGKVVSLTGKLASCGMENNEGICPSAESSIKTHCCEDHIRSFSLAGIFAQPASYIADFYPDITHISYMPVVQAPFSTEFSSCNFTDTGPPGLYSPTSVNLVSICTFRI
jgi:hypothetical protein